MQQPLKRRFLESLPALVGWFGVATTGVALLLYGYLGVFSRFYADDFCKSGLIVEHGFWPAQWIQYSTWSNRFAGMFTVGVSDLLGKWFIQLWTALTLLLWTCGLAWALWQAARLLRLSPPKWMTVLLAEWLVFFSLVQTPDLYQSLFWRMGNITYTLPLALLAFLCGMVIQAYLQLAAGRSGVKWALAAGLLAFFAGGFSETYLVLQTALLGGALLVVLLNKPAAAWRRPAAWAVGAALIGTLISLAVVLLSPGNAVRRALMPTPPGLAALIRMDLTSTFLFVYIALKNHAFQFLLASLAPMLLGYGYFASVKSGRLKPSSLILGLLLTPVLAVMAIAAVMAPASYAQSAYPDGRVLIIPTFILTLLLAAEGVLLGVSLSQLHHWADEKVPIHLQLFSAALAFGILLYPLYDARKSYRLIPEFRAEAQAWDERDASIRQARLDGAGQVVAVSLEAPAGMSELQTDPVDWVNTCVAMFYDVESIVATP